MSFEPTGQGSGGSSEGADVTEAIPGVAPGARKKNACPNCNEILSASSLTCEFCGHVVNRVVRPPQMPGFGGMPGAGASSILNEPHPTWDLRGGSYILDSLISTPLALVPMGGLLYMMLKDCISDGQSPGKRAGEMRVVDATTGAPCTVGQSFLRNIVLIIPLFFFVEVFLVWRDGVRLGDKIAGTRVVRPAAAGPCPKWGMALVVGFGLLSVAMMGLVMLFVVALCAGAYEGSKHQRPSVRTPPAHVRTR